MGECTGLKSRSLNEKNDTNGTSDERIDRLHYGNGLPTAEFGGDAYQQSVLSLWKWNGPMEVWIRSPCRQFLERTRTLHATIWWLDNNWSKIRRGLKDWREIEMKFRHTL